MPGAQRLLRHRFERRWIAKNTHVMMLYWIYWLSVKVLWLIFTKPNQSWSTLASRMFVGSYGQSIECS
jgi:hypothetical protein